jgi:hypothetical protein
VENVVLRGAAKDRGEQLEEKRVNVAGQNMAGNMTKRHEVKMGYIYIHICM